jgi:HAE1 family hydrophobic/amphiphilic exporter-1
VVVGGLALSALLTLVLVPPMLTLLVAPMEHRRQEREAEAAALEPAE